MRRALGLVFLVACGTNVVAGPTPDPCPVDRTALDPNGNPPSCGSGAKGGGTPTPRGDAASSLDGAGRTMVMFGGDSGNAPCGGIPGHTHLGDTWLFDAACGAWEEQTIDGPGARARHAMVTDAKRHRALLFGGRTREGDTGPYTVLNDLWAFDFSCKTWTKIDAGGTPPPPRSNTAMAIDASLDEVVVFGGNSSTDGLSFSPMNDTYILDLATDTWRAAATAARPPSRLFHALAIDESAHVAYTYSGGDTKAFTGPFLKDVWAFDIASETWSLVPTTNVPKYGRINFGMTFDATSRELVVVAGHDDGPVGNHNEVWTLNVDSRAWARAPGGDTLNKASTAQCVFEPDFTTIDKNAPERRQSFAFAPRPDGRGMVVAMGKGDCGLLSDAYWWNDAVKAWGPLKTTPLGLSCLRFKTGCTDLCN